MAISQGRRAAGKIRKLVREHQAWRGECLNILAAENISSPTVREIVASDLMHRYSEHEGHDIEKRFDEGGRFVIEIEKLTRDIAKKLFGARFAEIRPISGHIAVASCILSLMKPGGVSLEIKGSNGGHEWYYLAKNLPPMNYTPDWLPFDVEEWNVDADGARKKILETRPSVIILGSSFYLFPHPTKEIRGAADEVGARVVYDGAHVLGLIAGGEWPNPLELGADFLTGSTHKSFPGPQKGMILTNNGELLQSVMKAVYPGLLTNHHLMNVAALGYALAEFSEFGRAYSRQTVRNARALAQAISEEGLDVIGEKRGFTRSHQVLVKTEKLMSGNQAAKSLDAADIICNKMELEGANGLRIGTSEVTRVGMKESEMKEIARLVGDVLVRGRDPARVRTKVRGLTGSFKKIRYSFDRGDAYENPFRIAAR